MKPQPGDILLALKAINLCPQLKNHDRSVAAALLDHFNRKTGQCDPGFKRLAGLLGIHQRTVMRSMDRIEAARLFRRIRHGGHLNRNSYEPNWARFREIEVGWSARMKRKPDPATEMSPASCQPCHVDGDTSATQTCRRNLSKETSHRGLPTKEKCQGAGFSPGRASSPQPTTSSDAARTEAERRWHGELHRQFSQLPITYGEIIAAIDADMQAAATEAELRRRGAGFTYIVNRLRLGRGASARSDNG
jgi:hypothetical protein